MKIVEIFSSVEGEGSRSGVLCTFIRTFGCNLRCSYCDTKYSYEGNEFVNMTINEIVYHVNELGNKCVTLTGGEPLIQENIDELIVKLINSGHWVNIETNGSVPLVELYDKLSKYTVHNLYDNLMITMDYKCNCSGMTQNMNIDNLSQLAENDVLKFVVETIEDLHQALSVIRNYSSELQNTDIYLSPVYGKIDMKDIVEFMKEHNMQNVKLQIQLHKIIWPVNMRGV